jgi:RNA polymerase sigma factor (sigma-70 family)
MNYTEERKKERMPSDSELLQQFLNGDEAAFEVIIQRYEPLLMSFAYRFFRERERAEDMCQFVWLQLFLSRPDATSRPEGSLKAWLMKVLHHRCIDERRREKRHALPFSHLNQDEDTFVATLEDTSSLPEKIVEMQEDMKRVMDAIYQLPPKYRTIVTLKIYRHLSFDQISQMISCHPSVAKTRFYRAYPLLRRILEDHPLS